MKKIIEPGSGVDDLGGGIAAGCIKWVVIIVGVVFVIFGVLSFLKII